MYWKVRLSRVLLKTLPICIYTGRYNDFTHFIDKKTSAERVNHSHIDTAGKWLDLKLGDSIKSGRFVSTLFSFDVMDGANLLTLNELTTDVYMLVTTHIKKKNHYSNLQRAYVSFVSISQFC